MCKQNWTTITNLALGLASAGIGEPMPDTSDKIFDEMKSLAMWLEFGKMRSNLTSNLLGGYLLSDISTRLQAAVNATQATANGITPSYEKLLLISGHYNTLLGLLPALELDAMPLKDKYIKCAQGKGEGGRAIRNCLKLLYKQPNTLCA